VVVDATEFIIVIELGLRLTQKKVGKYRSKLFEDLKNLIFYKSDSLTYLLYA